MTSLLIECRDKLSETLVLLIVATPTATKAWGPPIVKSPKKPICDVACWRKQKRVRVEPQIRCGTFMLV